MSPCDLYSFFVLFCFLIHYTTVSLAWTMIQYSLTRRNFVEYAQNLTLQKSQGGFKAKHGHPSIWWLRLTVLWLLRVSSLALRHYYLYINVFDDIFPQRQKQKTKTKPPAASLPLVSTKPSSNKSPTSPLLIMYLPWILLFSCSASAPLLL